MAKQTYTTEKVQLVKRLREEGRSYKDIAVEAKVPPSSINWLLKKTLRGPKKRRTRTRAKQGVAVERSLVTVIRSVLDSKIDDTSKLLVLDFVVPGR